MAAKMTTCDAGTANSVLEKNSENCVMESKFLASRGDGVGRSQIKLGAGLSIRAFPAKFQMFSRVMFFEGKVFGRE